MGRRSAALAVDRMYRIVAPSDGVAATAASHAPQSKIVKGYLAFIQGLGSPLRTDPDPCCSVGTHPLLTQSSPCSPGYSPSSPRCFFIAPWCPRIARPAHPET